LLTKPNVKEYLAKCEEKAFKNADLNAEYVLKRLKKIVDDDISNYMKWKTVFEKVVNTETMQIDVKSNHIVELLDSENIDTWNIQEVSVGKDGQFKFKLHCKDKALFKLGEHFGLWSKLSDQTDQATALEGLIKSLDKAVK